MALRFIEQACSKHGVQLTVLSDGWVLELRKDGRLRRVVGSNFDLNDQAASALARDKVAMAAVLNARGIKHVPHRLLKARDDVEIDGLLLDEMLAQGAVVLKPLEGSSGDLITKADDAHSAIRFVKQSGVSSWAVSPFVDIEQEIRLVMHEAAAWLTYAKTDPVLRRGVRLFNLSKGAKALPLTHVDEALLNLATDAMTAAGLRLGAVDIVRTSDDSVAVLEINAGFSLTRYAQTNEATFEQVASFYDRIVADMFGV